MEATRRIGTVIRVLAGFSRAVYFCKRFTDKRALLSMIRERLLINESQEFKVQQVVLEFGHL